MGVFHLLPLGISTACGSILEILKIVSLFIKLPRSVEAVMAVIVWQLDLHLPTQSVPITTDVVCSNLDQGKVYNIM